jgi:hypothetical protein
MDFDNPFIIMGDKRTMISRRSHVLSLIAIALFLSACPAGFTPTGPLAGDRAASSTSPDADTEANIEDSSPPVMEAPAATGADEFHPISGNPNSGAAANEGGLGDGGPGGPISQPIASNEAPGTIAAPGDQAVIGREPFVPTARQLRHGPDFATVVPPPPDHGNMAIKFPITKDVALIAAYQNQGLPMWRGYPPGTQFRAILILDGGGISFLDAVSLETQGKPVNPDNGANLVFPAVPLARGSLAVYAYENFTLDEEGVRHMSRTADFQSDGFSPMTPLQLSQFILNGFTEHLGTFHVGRALPSTH